MMGWFRRPTPVPLPPTPSTRIITVALSDLIRRARREVLEPRRIDTMAALAGDIAAGRIAHLQPRPKVVAPITARRATTKGA